MAKDTQNRGSSSVNRESQWGSRSQQINGPNGSEQQINDDPQSGSSSNISDTQSSNQHASAGIPGSLCDRVDLPGVISHRLDDTLPNSPGGPGTASSQCSNAASTGTGSDGLRVTIPRPDSYPVWEGILDRAVLEKLGSDRKT